MLTLPLNLIKVKDSEYQAELFLTYSPINHTMAHLYEHLIVSEIRQSYDNDFLVKYANTGSGIINIKIKRNRKIIKQEDLQNILTLKNIKPANFNLEKERLANELEEELNGKNKIFYQALQHNILSYKKLLSLFKKISAFRFGSLQKFVKTISRQNIWVILAGPSFKNNILPRIKDKNNNIKIESKNLAKVFKLPVINGTQNKFTEINFKIKIDNNLEAQYLSIAANLAGKHLDNVLKEQGIYQIKSHLYKDYDSYLYWGFNFFVPSKKREQLFKLITNEVVRDLTNKGLFLSEKKELIKILKEINNQAFLKKAEDYMWQKLEFGSYMAPKEEMEKIKKLNLNKLNLWWRRKIKSAEVYKVV